MQLLNPPDVKAFNAPEPTPTFTAPEVIDAPLEPSNKLVNPKFSVKVDPEPINLTVVLAVIMLKLLLTSGFNWPPVFPVKCSTAAPPPARLTNPFASTVNCAELKAANPIFVAFVDAIAWLFCITPVTVFPDPVNSKGIVPGAEVVPSTFKMFATGTAVPEFVTNEVGTEGGNVPTDTLNAPDWLIIPPFRKLPLHKPYLFELL